MKTFLIAIVMCFSSSAFAKDMRVVDENGTTSEFGGVITSGSCENGTWRWYNAGRRYYLICVPN